MMYQPMYMRHLYSGFEPCQAFDVVYGTTFEHRLLSAKQATMAHQRLVIGDIRLETGGYNFPVVAQGCMPKKEVCIGFMAEGEQVTRCNTMALESNEIQIYPPGVELLYHASGPSRWVNFVVPEESLQAFATARVGRPIHLSRHAAYSMRLRNGARHALTRITDDALGLAHRLEPVGGISSELGAEIYHSLLGSYVDQIFDSTPLNQPEKSATEIRHHQLITACERLVVSGEDTDIALAEIAKRSGYSLRSLELIFRRSVGMTPGRWFMTARLNGALRDLLNCEQDGTVSEVAMKWGFRHVSRFSQYYRNAFGELPSETLKRTRQQ
ncbi:HTH araC/xylS-type domain-containing protein [Bordetella tumbae]|uniref:helix-turn-helix transcriptional regulator n=1 Tax=Bordetella tumbae TaxID=1649139 RepID=UPI0039EE3DB9